LGLFEGNLKTFLRGLFFLIEFEKVDKGDYFYWVWADEDFLPYVWPSQKDIESAPKPVLLRDIHPDWPIGFVLQILFL
jgi:hypothetical protein